MIRVLNQINLILVIDVKLNQVLFPKSKTHDAFQNIFLTNPFHHF